MIVETERLWLRPVTADDLPELIRLRADEEVSRFIGGVAMQSPEAVAKRLNFYLDCHAQYGFGPSMITLKSAGEVIGWGGLQPLEETGEIEVGYGFAKPHWGHGYATETAAAWLRYGFERAGLARIVAVADPANKASWDVMEKLGMTYETTEQHYGSECVVYAISRAEFKPRDSFYLLHDSEQTKGKDG